MSSSSNLQVIAAVLAGGTGQRLSSELPKQFVEVAGQPLLAHSLLAFQKSAEIDSIIIVSHADHLDRARRVATDAGITKLANVVAGGNTRSESSLAAIAASPAADALLLIHDAARPLVDISIIRAVVGALENDAAAAPALVVSDTIAQATGDSIEAMPARESMHRMQTPQGFHVATLRKAYDLAAADADFVATDDCGVVNRYLPEVNIRLVTGSPRNIKVTQEQDLKLAELLLGG